MASAFSMLFFTLFSDGGPINSLLMQIGFIARTPRGRIATPLAYEHLGIEYDEK